MKHVVNPGTSTDTGRLFVTIQYENGRLSITGVEGPKKNGDARGSCGQIVMSGLRVDTYADGWDAAKLATLAKVWDRWHLNDMRAGSAVQESYLRAHPVTAVYPGPHYVKASAVLTKAGLNPDANGYKYGSAWKSEDVPAEVIDWLFALPVGEADRLPHAWA